MFGVKRYDCNFFDTHFKQECIDDIEFMFSTEGYKPNCPEQTIDILFNNHPKLSKNWQILKKSFLESVYDYSGEHFLHGLAWCFRNQKNVPPFQWNWHFHRGAKYSGIFYLNLPTDCLGNFCYTTEFEIDGGRTMFVEPVVGSWFIFNGKHVHRNGYWIHEKMNGNRYCVAASVF